MVEGAILTLYFSLTNNYQLYTRVLNLPPDRRTPNRNQPGNMVLPPETWSNFSLVFNVRGFFLHNMLIEVNMVNTGFTVTIMKQGRRTSYYNSQWGVVSTTLERKVWMCFLFFWKLHVLPPLLVLF